MESDRFYLLPVNRNMHASKLTYWNLFKVAIERGGNMILSYEYLWEELVKTSILNKSVIEDRWLWFTYLFLETIYSCNSGSHVFSN